MVYPASGDHDAVDRSIMKGKVVDWPQQWGADGSISKRLPFGIHRPVADVVDGKGRRWESCSHRTNNINRKLAINRLAAHRRAALTVRHNCPVCIYDGDPKWKTREEVRSNESGPCGSEGY